jgi:hypothetical protein
VARNLKLEIEGDSTGGRRALESSAREADKLRRAADKLGNEFRRASQQAGGLDRQLTQTKQAVRSLAAEFNRTGDVKILGQLKEQRVELEKQSALRRDIIGDTERQAKAAKRAFDLADRDRRSLLGTLGKQAIASGAESASNFKSLIEGGLINAFKSLPPPVQGAIGGGIALAITSTGPIIGAAMASAVLLGVGAAGLGAGIALAIRNEKVKDSFKAVGKDMLAGLEDAAAPFQAELIATAKIFKDGFADVAPDLKGLFGDLSKAVQPLARGLVGFVKSIMPGLRDAAAAAVPLFKAIGAELPRLGAAMSIFFSSIADAGPGAVIFFRLLLIGIGALIISLGALIEFTATALTGLSKLPGGKFLLGEDADIWAQDHQKAFDGTAISIEELGGKAKEAAFDVQGLGYAFDTVISRRGGLLDATIAYEQALDDLSESVKNNGKSLDITGQKGRDNTRALKSAIEAAREKYDADVLLNGVTDENSAAYQRNLEQIRKNAAALGLNKQQVEALITSLGGIPPVVDTTVITHGLGEANRDLSNLRGSLLGLDNFVIDIFAKNHTAGLASSVAQSIKRRASGGPVTAGQPYIVGENRPELFVPNVSGRIVPRVPGGGGGGTTHLSVPINVNGRTLVEAIIEVAANRGVSTARLLRISAA